MPLYGDQYMQFQDAESCRAEREGQALLGNNLVPNQRVYILADLF